MRPYEITHVYVLHSLIGNKYNMTDNDTCRDSDETRHYCKSPKKIERQRTLSAAPGRAEAVRSVALLLDCVDLDLCVPSQLRLAFASCG